MATQLSLMQIVERSERRIYVRCVDHASARRWWRAFWTVLTYLGGTASSIGAAVVPLLLSSSSGPLYDASRHAFVALFVSHLVVQIVKRIVNRPRPSLREATASLVPEPDKFSFPSGHSCAAMAVCSKLLVVSAVQRPVHG